MLLYIYIALIYKSILLIFLTCSSFNMLNEDIHTIHSTVKIGYKYKGINPKNSNGIRHIHGYELI